MNNVVLLIRNVRPDMYGGGETYQLMLADELKRHGFTPVIVTSSHKLIDEAKKRKIKVVIAPYNERQDWSGVKNLLLPFYYIWQIKLRNWYKGLFAIYQPVVVNIQSRDDWIAGTLAAKKAGIRVLWTDHMDLRSWVLTNVNVKYKNLIGKWILKNARYAYKIIMISDFEAAFFKKIVDGKIFRNVVVVKNGVVDRYEEFKSKAEKNTVCYVGRIVDYKGIGELIMAFAKVALTYEDAKLNIYGAGSKNDLEHFKRMAAENKNIRFCGYADEPLEALSRNEIFVLASYREGLSLSLLDAAMMKKKIIASDVGGNPEVVIDGKTGLLVPAHNVEKLADAMIWMMSNRDTASEMADKVRKKYTREFDFNRIFDERMLVLYNIGKEKK